MFTETEAPGTSAPVVAFTNFTACVPLLPATQTRPRAETASGLETGASVIPTHPPKSVRKIGAFNAYPVRKAVGGAALHWKLAVTVIGPDMVTVWGLELPLRPPLQFPKLQTG